MSDAVVIGAGPNGLVAANMLLDAGWTVEVLEAAPTPGGAVRTEELTLPGFRHDVGSAFYPLGVASPALRSLALEDHGLRWIRPPVAVAHIDGHDRAAAVGMTPEETGATLEPWCAGDAQAWKNLYGRWEVAGDAFLRALLSPFPPLRAGLDLARQLGRRGLLELARLSVVPVRRLAEEEFGGEGGALLLAGNALHADLMPETAASGMFGWLLACLAQDVGFPVPQGGAGRLTDALVRRLESRGGVVRCGHAVVGVDVRNGRAVGVRLDSGERVDAGRAVLADVAAPTLYLDLVGTQHLPGSLLADLRRFQWDAATVKVDWALDRPVPWTADTARRAGTVHLSPSMDHLTMWAAQLATGHVPADPLLIVGQQSLADPTRCPPGTATLWAYTHIPRQVRGDAGGNGITGAWTGPEREAIADRFEATIEARAPGFRHTVMARHILTPPDLEDRDRNLVGGAINGGTAQIHQQLIFRPVLGWGRAETPVRGLFLASSSAHPGGGVHGACGANAARAALAAQRRRTLTVSGRRPLSRAR
jgi:phytoene dehydrogenase-like protein